MLKDILAICSVSHNSHNMYSTVAASWGKGVLHPVFQFITHSDKYNSHAHLWAI